MKKCEDLERMVLEPPLEEDSRRVYVAYKRMELCKWKTLLESEVANVARALENYSSTADDLDPQTPSLPDILQKVNANVETTAQHMDTAYSAITTIEMFLEELDNVTKEHKDSVPNRSPDVPPMNLKQLLGKFTEDVQRQVLRRKEQDSPERSWDTATLLSVAKSYIAMELKIVSRTNKKREHHPPAAQSFKEKTSSCKESQRRTERRNCFYCGKQDHVPRDCEFVRTREARLDIIRKKKLCHNCGAKDHMVSQRMGGPCRLCKQHGHHTSVCRQLFSAPAKPSAAQDVKTVTQPQTSSKTTPKRSKTSISTKVNTTLTEQGQVQDGVPNTAVYVNHHRNGTNVHILVGQAQVLNPRNQALEVVHVMLDTGADRSFISTQLADHLELRDIKSVELSISTFGSQQPLKRTCGVTELQMWDAQGKAHKVTVTKIDTVTEPILRSNLSHEDKQFLCDHNMSLSINSNVTDLHPQVLLGCADLYSFLDKGLTAETSLPSGLKLIPSKLGYLVSGRVSDSDDDFTEDPQEVVEFRRSEEGIVQAESVLENAHKELYSANSSPEGRSSPEELISTPRYELRPRKRVNYSEDTAHCATVHSSGRAPMKLFVTCVTVLMLATGVTSKAAAVGQMSCVSGGVSISTHSIERYEICAEHHCYLENHPKGNETIRFPPEILLHTYNVQLKLFDGQNLTVLETSCPPESFCDHIQCWFCTANVFNPECSPRAAITAITIILYISIALLYALCYVPMVFGKPCRIVGKAFWSLCKAVGYLLWKICCRRLVRRRQRYDVEALLRTPLLAILGTIAVASACQDIDMFSYHDSVCMFSAKGIKRCALETTELM
ncbi:hypothetical protein GCK32_008249 [Trichostrongylus colubriformis]|uniref:CCHC-type domain-containing protein n=1 Tax=Trichostrongylus colubriformis TaxID=6319 RepID=A0AAN8IIM1_TRICO